MSGSTHPLAAAQVDPTTIASRVSYAAGVELLLRSRPPGSVNAPHGQQEHMLMCTVGSPLEGGDVSSVLETEDSRREWSNCPNGEVTFVPAGFPMAWAWNYQSRSTHLILPTTFINAVGTAFEHPDGAPPKLNPFFRIADHQLNSLLCQLREESTENELGRDLVTSSLLQLIAARIYRLNDAPFAGTPGELRSGSFSELIGRRCIEILNDRLDEKISLSELAAEFNLSPYHFARIFKRETGFPPHEYQLQLRIRRARELLSQKPSVTIAAIACQLGFADENHFRRHFRRIVGTTPGQYRSQQ